MNVPLKIKAGHASIKVVRPSKPTQMPVRPKRAVKVPSVSTRPPVAVVRVPKKKQPVHIQKPRMPQPVKVKDDRVVDVVRRVPNHKRKRTLSNNRPSNMKKVRDDIIWKYATKVRGLQEAGRNKILIIISCGPSANEVDIEELQKHPKIDLMCVNKPDERVWPTPYWIFCDQSQYVRNKSFWESYNGVIINAASVRAWHQNQILIRSLAGKGFSRDMTKGVHIGRSTTYTAMQVALYMNYHKIYIIGCDMSKPEAGKPLHRYGVNPDVNESIRVQRFAKEAENYDHGAKILKDYECNRFTFCSEQNQWSFVDLFNRISQYDTTKCVVEAANELLTVKEYEEHKS